MYSTQKVNGLWRIARPATVKSEYHGNGKNSWDGHIDKINGHKIEYVSVRHSYRWHKTIVRFDGRQLKSAKDYRDAEAKLNF